MLYHLSHGWRCFFIFLGFLYITQNTKKKKEFVEVVKIQEYKLYKYIGVPALWATVVSGVAMLLLNPALLSGGGWMHAKITMVILLIAYSYSLNHFRKQLELGICQKSGKFFRAYNEVPTILSILIVIFVIVKPF